jgi:outer membrane protein
MKANLFAKALGMSALASTLSVAAQAGDLPSAKSPLAPAPVVETFQPLFVKLGVTYAINTSFSKLYPALTGAEVSNITTLGFEAGYFITRNISINVSAGIPFYAKDKVKGTSPIPQIAAISPNGTVLSNIMPALIPVTAVYHVDAFGAFQPFVGVGVAQGFSFSNQKAFLYNVKVSGSLGFVAQAGFDYMISQHWGLSFDAKKVFTYVDAHSDGIVLGGVQIPQPVVQHTHFQPWLLSAGLVYRFGAQDLAPVVAKY